MSILTIIQGKRLAPFYEHIDKEADKEVALAMQFSLKDENWQDQFYSPRFLLPEFLSDSEAFEALGLKFLPTDVVSLLFKCKLLFAVKDEHEFRQRGGGGTFFDSLTMLPNWADRSTKPDLVAER